MGLPSFSDEHAALRVHRVRKWKHFGRKEILLVRNDKGRLIKASIAKKLMFMKYSRSIHGGDISSGTAATAYVFVTNKAKNPIATST